MDHAWLRRRRLLILCGALTLTALVAATVPATGRAAAAPKSLLDYDTSADWSNYYSFYGLARVFEAFLGDDPFEFGCSFDKDDQISMGKKYQGKHESLALAEAQGWKTRAYEASLAKAADKNASLAEKQLAAEQADKAARDLERTKARDAALAILEKAIDAFQNKPASKRDDLRKAWLALCPLRVRIIANSDAKAAAPAAGDDAAPSRLLQPNVPVSASVEGTLQYLGKRVEQETTFLFLEGLQRKLDAEQTSRGLRFYTNLFPHGYQVVRTTRYATFDQLKSAYRTAHREDLAELPSRLTEYRTLSLLFGDRPDLINSVRLAAELYHGSREGATAPELFDRFLEALLSEGTSQEETKRLVIARRLMHEYYRGKEPIRGSMANARNILYLFLLSSDVIENKIWAGAVNQTKVLAAIRTAVAGRIGAAAGKVVTDATASINQSMEDLSAEATDYAQTFANLRGAVIAQLGDNRPLMLTSNIIGALNSCQVPEAPKLNLLDFPSISLAELLNELSPLKNDPLSDHRVLFVHVIPRGAKPPGTQRIPIKQDCWANIHDKLLDLLAPQFESAIPAWYDKDEFEKVKEAFKTQVRALKGGLQEAQKILEAFKQGRKSLTEALRTEFEARLPENLLGEVRSLLLRVDTLATFQKGMTDSSVKASERIYWTGEFVMALADFVGEALTLAGQERFKSGLDPTKVEAMRSALGNIAEIVSAVEKRSYTTAANTLVRFYSSMRSGPTGAGFGMAGLTSDEQAIARFVLMSGALADAGTDEEVAAIIEQFAAPVGSYRRKRHHPDGENRSTFAVNAYVGVAVGQDRMRTLHSGAKVQDGAGKHRYLNYAGLAAPIGLDWAHPLSEGKSWSLFFSIVDPGLISTFRKDRGNLRIEEESAQAEPATEMTWVDVFSPGLYVVRGCSNTLPFAVGFGYAMTPGLRTVKSQTSDLETKADSYRWSIFIAYDLPLYFFR